MIAPGTLSSSAGPSSSEDASRYSSALKSRPATSFRPRVSMNWSSAMYVVALRVDCCCSCCRRTPLFHEEFTNGTLVEHGRVLDPGNGAQRRRVGAGPRVLVGVAADAQDLHADKLVLDQGR